MDRKRAFNRAFSPSSGDPFKKALRSVQFSSTVSSPQIFDTSAFLFGSNKENATPFFQAEKALSKFEAVPGQQRAFAPHVKQTQLRLPLGTHSLQDCSELQQTANSFGAQDCATIPMQLGQFGSSPPGFASDPNSSSPADDILGSYLDSEPGPVIFEDDNAICGQLNQDPLTPSALHFGELTLQEVPKEHRPVLPVQSMLGTQRTNVFMMPSSVFQPCFPNILPNEVVIAFDKGKQVMKIDKYPLCSESRFFTQMLDQPFVVSSNLPCSPDSSKPIEKDGQIRCIRLRDDFPYAIAAMIQFIEDNTYIFNQQMRVEYPYITLLDLHVHAYVVGSKYDVARLCDHAVGEYVNVAGMVLAMGLPPNIDLINLPNDNNLPLDSAGDFSMDFADPTSQPMISDPNASPGLVVFNSFLDSLVLIWRNTCNRDDALRQAILELIKPELNNLMRLSFFQTLMKDMVGFCDDIMYSLERDGFDVSAFPVYDKLQKTGVRFDGA